METESGRGWWTSPFSCISDNSKVTTEMTREPSHHTTTSYYFYSGLLLIRTKFYDKFTFNTNQLITNTPYIKTSILQMRSRKFKHST